MCSPPWTHCQLPCGIIPSTICSTDELGPVLGAAITESLILCLQCGGKLQTSMSGPAYDVFAKALRGLGAAKLTKPGNFRTADGHGLAVRCSYKVGDFTATQRLPLCLVLVLVPSEVAHCCWCLCHWQAGVLKAQLQCCC